MPDKKGSAKKGSGSSSSSRSGSGKSPGRSVATETPPQGSRRSSSSQAAPGEVRQAISGRESELAAIALFVLGLLIGLAVDVKLAGPVGRGADTALGAVSRLVDMGVERFLWSSSLVGVLAQRLVRVLCPDCKRARLATPTELKFLGTMKAQVWEPVGCDACGHSGYRGRTGIYELVPVDDVFRQMVHDEASEQELTRYVRRTHPGIRDDGIDKVLKGMTTVQEVVRVTIDGA